MTTGVPHSTNWLRWDRHSPAEGVCQGRYRREFVKEVETQLRAHTFHHSPDQMFHIINSVITNAGHFFPKKPHITEEYTSLRERRDKLLDDRRNLRRQVEENADRIEVVRSELREVTKQCKILRRKAGEAQDKITIESIRDAEKKGRKAEVFMLCRRLSKRSIGPKKEDMISQHKFSHQFKSGKNTWNKKGKTEDVWQMKYRM